MEERGHLLALERLYVSNGICLFFLSKYNVGMEVRHNLGITGLLELSQLLQSDWF